MLLAPVVRSRKGEHEQVLNSLRSQVLCAYALMVRFKDLSEVGCLDLRRNDIEVVIDRLKVKKKIKDGWQIQLKRLGLKRWFAVDS